MGLLDNLSNFAASDQGMALAQGLLSANGSQGIAAGLAGMQQAKQMQQQRAMQEQAMAAQALQMQAAQLQLQNARRDASRSERIDALAPQFNVSPERADALSQGPSSPENPMQQVKPGFNWSGYADAVSGIDPKQGLAYHQAMAKESPLNKIDVKDYDPASVAKYLQTKNPADLVIRVKNEIGPNGQAYNPFTIQAGTVLADANKPFSGFGPDGKPIANTDFQKYEINKAGAGAARNNTTVSVAGPENEYNKTIGKGLADVGLATVDVAKSAPDTIRNAQMIRQAIGSGAITGTGAEARLAVQKALETAGVVGAGKAADTQALMSGLANMTLSGVKTSGLGAGNGFTDKDLAFLQSAKSGSIDSTPENILRAADLSERVARANHAKGAAVLGRWNNDKALRNVAQDTMLDPLPEPAAPNKNQNTAPSKQFKVDGGAVIGQLGADGNYYVTRNGKKYRIED